MKTKLLSVIFHLFITIFIFIVFYYYNDTINYNNIINLGREVQNIPYINSYDLLLDTQNTIDCYDKIKETADKYNANIYTSKVKNENGTKEITKYIYVNDYSLFDDLPLESGRFFDKNNIESDSFISSEVTNDNNQIGQLTSFSGDTTATIKTLYKGLDENALKLSATVIIKKSDYSKFEAELKNYGIKFMTITRNDELPAIDKSLFYIIIFFSVMIIVLLNIYELFNNYKAIAVKKMLGYSYASLCFEKITFIAVSQTITSVLVYIVLSTLMFSKRTSLFRRFSMQILIMYGAVLVFSVLSVLVVYLISNKFSTATLIKNNNCNFAMIISNFVFKTITGVFAVLYSCEVLLNVNSLHINYDEKLNKWDEVKDYYCISGISCINDDYHYDPGISDEDITASYNVYCELNKKGAILCCFNDPSDRIIKDYEDDHGKENVFIFLTSFINPNYLDKNEIYDINGDRVLINDDSDKVTYLIPEKHRSQIDYAYKYIELWNEHNENKDIDIIWIKNGQKVFTYNSFLEYDKGDYRTDPVLRVNTIANSQPDDFWYFAGAANGPVKVECKNEDDIRNFYEILYKYFDNTLYAFDIYNFYDSVSAEADKVTFMMKYLAIAAVCSIITLALSIIQNIKVYFREFEKETAVYFLHGYSFFRMHIVLLVGTLISFSVVFFINIIKFHSLKATLIIAAFGAAEFAVTIILAIIFNRKNIVNTLKKA